MMHKSGRLRTLYNACSNIKYYSTETETIVIPKRIHREPTDILRAIAKTYKRDPGAPHYKFHDDPYLIPYSNTTKRSYALSKEAGRKAAYWVRKEHADLFNHAHAEPMIESVLPPPTYDENTNYTVEDLNDTLKHFLVADSLVVYNSLIRQKIDIDPKTKQSFLEMMCFYNEEDGVMDDWIEERWFWANSKENKEIKKTWRDNGIAEMVFKSMKDPPAEAYCAIICGMSKFGQLDGAMRYYKEAKSKGLELNVSVYNSLLAKGKFIKENPELIWQTEEALMVEMKKDGVAPNLLTFNSVLYTLGEIASYPRSQELSLQVLSEMKRCGIKPSLATFSHLLKIHYSDKGQRSSLLYSIVEYLEENDELEMRDVKDIQFFVKAMEMCRHRIRDMQLAYRIDSVLHTKNNYNLLGDSFSESIYHRYLFLLACLQEEWNELMKLYNNLVPHVYVPEPMVMIQIMTALELNMAYSHIPQLWTDLVQFKLNEQEAIINKFLSLLSQSAESHFHPQLLDIGWSAFEKLNGQTRERNAIPWNGDMLSDLLVVFLKGNDTSKAIMIVDKIIRLQNTLVGEVRISALKAYIEMCVQENLIDLAIRCIGYCRQVGFMEAEEFAETLKTSLQLDEQQLNRLNLALARETDS